MNVAGIVGEVDVCFDEAFSDGTRNITCEEDNTSWLILLSVMKQREQLVNRRTSQIRSLHLNGKPEWPFGSVDICCPVVPQVALIVCRSIVKFPHERDAS